MTSRRRISAAYLDRNRSAAGLRAPLFHSHYASELTTPLVLGSIAAPNSGFSLSNNRLPSRERRSSSSRQRGITRP